MYLPDTNVVSMLDPRRHGNAPDLIIAATAARHGLIVLTRNKRDFSRLGVPVLDPFERLPPDI